MPKGIRPTQDKVRKAVFDILGDISGLAFLELFAGSGAVGLEALSRGAADLVLVELNRNCLAVIRKNIEMLKAACWSILDIEAQMAVVFLRGQNRVFDIIFLDPPYHAGLAKKTLQTLEAYDILAPNGLVVVQHFKAEEFKSAVQKFVLLKEAKYGDTWLSIFRKKE